VACARGVDLFVCECSFADDAAVEHHLTPTSAARIAAEAQVKELVLTHFYPSLEPGAAAQIAGRTFGGSIRCARELQRLVR